MKKKIKPIRNINTKHQYETSIQKLTNMKTIRNTNTKNRKRKTIRKIKTNTQHENQY